MIERDGDQVRVTGALVVENVVAVCAELARELGDQPLVVDLGAVTEVDSAALSALFEVRREAQRRNAQVSFRNFPASLRSLATLYGVSDLVGDSQP